MTSQVRSVAPLGEALHLLQMSGTFYCRSEFTEPWGLDVPPMTGCLMFHVVTSGRCWLEVHGATPQLLEAGDLALVPHGEGHRLRSEPAAEAARLFDLSREQVSDRYEIIRYGGGGAPSVLICGAFRFDHPAGRQLLSQLPRLITVQRWNSPRADWIQSALHFIAEEARELRAGGETVITRLADILVIQAIGSWLEQDPAARTGWLRAVQDAQIGRAMSLIHRDPSRAWTVE